jgi:hypothetical protein
MSATGDLRTGIGRVIRNTRTLAQRFTYATRASVTCRWAWRCRHPENGLTNIAVNEQGGLRMLAKSPQTVRPPESDSCGNTRCTHRQAERPAAYRLPYFPRRVGQLIVWEIDGSDLTPRPRNRRIARFASSHRELLELRMSARSAAAAYDLCSRLPRAVALPSSPHARGARLSHLEYEWESRPEHQQIRLLPQAKLNGSSGGESAAVRNASPWLGLVDR